MYIQGGHKKSISNFPDISLLNQKISLIYKFIHCDALSQIYQYLINSFTLQTSNDNNL